MTTIQGYRGRESERERDEKNMRFCPSTMGRKKRRKGKGKRKVKGKHGGNCRDVFY